MTTKKIAAFGSSYRVYANSVQELPEAAIFSTISAHQSDRAIISFLISLVPA